MKIIIVTLFLFCLTIFLNGCKENPVDNTSAIPNSIKKIWISDSHYTEYQYSGKLLTKKTLISDGSIISSNIFSYDDNYQLVRKDDYSIAAGIPLSSYLTYEYSSNNVLIKTKAYLKINNDFEYRGYTLFEYETSRLIKYSFYNSNDELRNYHILTYNNDNVVEDAQYNSNGNSENTQTFEYDNKLNPLLMDKSFISAFTISKNNVTKWTTTYYLDPVNNINTSTSTYVYNILGNPVKCTTLYSNNGIPIDEPTISVYEYY